jgi:dihydroxy-acid dehydratase
MADKKLRYRSQYWFNNPDDPEMTALYCAWQMNDGTTREELQSGKPIIGIAQSGSDITPCNKIHRQTVEMAKKGVIEAGGIPFVFPSFPLQETTARPTAHLYRNLAAMTLIEILYAYPIDGVILTTGCDKTTPSALMAAATVNLPAIVLSGGPMLNGHFEGKLSGSGMAVWEARRRLKTGEMNEDQFFDAVASSAPSLGHCNTMGTASTMNSMAEALGMSLTGSAIIPAPYGARQANAYWTGRRAVEITEQNIRPRDILTRAAFENAIVTLAAIGGSTNAHQHLTAIARHAEVELPPSVWTDKGYHVPLLVNLQPAGAYLGEDFYQAGGVPAVMHELLDAGLLNADAMTISGKRVKDAVAETTITNKDVIRPFSEPLEEDAGFAVLSSNFFDFGLMKVSVISPQFRKDYLSRPGHENVFEARVTAFEGREDYHERINDPSLNIDRDSILVMRGAGPLGWPGSAEVVNMQPPDALLAKGIRMLPTIGDGRQSGTSDSPSILHVAPESALGEGLALLRDGDILRVDLNKLRCDVLLSDAELDERRRTTKPSRPPYHTPWQEIHGKSVGPLQFGACSDFMLDYHDVGEIIPRHNH